MSKKLFVLFIFMSGIISSTVMASHSHVQMDDLKRQADHILSCSTAIAREKVDVVFELADRLLTQNQPDDAEKYLLAGLRCFPWDLTHQMVYAELMEAEGKKDLAIEKSRLVLNHAETDQLIQRAQDLLNRHSTVQTPQMEFEPMTTISGNDACVVLVPLQNCQVWLLARMRQQLTESLGIPVYIQRVTLNIPASARDRRGLILNQIRRNIFKDAEKNPALQTAIQQLGFSLEDLRKEENLLLLIQQLSGPVAFQHFETELTEKTGEDLQWNAQELQNVLLAATAPYRRKNVAYLGVTSEDMFAKDYNYLFGWAEIRGGVMSHHRFSAEFNHTNPDQNRLVKRSVVQALASIGNIFGLSKCTNPTCALAYPNSLKEHDAKEMMICPRCKAEFDRIVHGEPGQKKTESSVLK